MKRALTIAVLGLTSIFLLTAEDCDNRPRNTTALDEQAHSETNQRTLFAKQPPPDISWSLERDNLIKRFKLQNDRAVNFYMYIFIEGVAEPVGYYQVNKVSSVDSQLTNPMQVLDKVGAPVVPSPAEDGSYGTNGTGVFGFTPEDVYIEHNMHYIVSTIPLTFAHPVVRLAVVNTDEARAMVEKSKKAMQ